MNKNLKWFFLSSLLFFKYKDQKYTFTYSHLYQFLLHIWNCVILHFWLTKKIVILVSNNYEKMLDCALVEKLIKEGSSFTYAPQD
jgi:hypothetical protein